MPTGPPSTIISMRPSISWQHMLRRGGAGTAGGVGAGRCHRHPRQAQSVGWPPGPTWHPDRHRIQSRPWSRRALRSLFGKNQRHAGRARTRPSAFYAVLWISRGTRGSTSSIFATWAIRGLSEGRPLACIYLPWPPPRPGHWPPDRTPSPSGNATRPPFFRMAAASISSSSVVFTTFVFIIFSFLRNFPYYLWDDLAKCSYYPQDDSH